MSIFRIIFFESKSKGPFNEMMQFGMIQGHESSNAYGDETASH